MSFRFDDVMQPTRVATHEEVLKLREKYRATLKSKGPEKGSKENRSR